MSFDWTAIDQRERNKLDKDKEWKDYLRNQQEETKNRRLRERRGEWDDNRNIFGLAPPQKQPDIAKAASSESSSNYKTTSRDDYASPTPRAILQTSQPGASTTARLSSFDRQNQPPPPPLPPTYLPALPSAPTLPPPPPTDDITLLSHLRATETTLQDDRRARARLESDLSAGRALLATLSAKIDSLSHHVATDSARLSDISSRIADVERKAQERAGDVAARTEQEMRRVQTVVAEVAARQRRDERVGEDAEERGRGLVDELGRVRFTVEGVVARVGEVESELRARGKAMEGDRARAMEVERAVKELDRALDGVRGAVEGAAQTMDGRMGDLAEETRQRIEAEVRGRGAFEGSIRDTLGEMRRGVQALERELMDRIESGRNNTTQMVEREREERQKDSQHLLETLKTLDRTTRDTHTQTTEKLTLQISSLSSSLTDEHTARTRFETSLRTELEESLRLVQTSLLQRIDDLTQSQTDLRSALGIAVKTLQESIILVEKSTHTKLSATSDVLRAEIKARMDLSDRVDAVPDETDFKLDAAQKRFILRVDEAREEARVAVEKVGEELKKTADGLAQAKTRSAEDLELQITQLRRRVKEGETTVGERFKGVDVKCQRVEQLVVDATREFETRLQGVGEAMTRVGEETNRRCEDAESLCTGVKNEVEEHIRAQNVQMDQTMEAFKNELKARPTFVDVRGAEGRVSDALRGISVKLDETVERVGSVEVDVKSRTTVEEVEKKLKDVIGVEQQRTTRLESAVAEGRREIATFATKEDVRNLHDELKVRDTQLDESVRSLKLEVVSKSDLAQTEVNARVGEMETKHGDLFSRLDTIQSTCASKSSLTDCETRLTTHLNDVETRVATLLDAQTAQLSTLTTHTTALDAAVESLNLRVSDTNATTRDLITSHLTDLLDAQTAHLTALDASVESLKLRVSDSESTVRDRVRDHAKHTQEVLASHVTMIDTVRDALQDRVEGVSSRLDALLPRMDAIESAHEETRQEVVEALHTETEQLIRHISDVRESLALRATVGDMDTLRADIVQAVQKVAVQVEIDRVATDQVRYRV
ncbi:hypothetical protein HK104_004382, partial [Borealophlyctis nickersoniae]